MLKRDTTFIIGAGASFDLGFPLGDTLRDNIIALLRTVDIRPHVAFEDGVLQSVVERRAAEEAGANAWPSRMDIYLRAASTIRDGLPFARSIDSFLDGLRDQPEVVFLGKLAITMAIVRAEAGSPLAFRRVRAANADEIAKADLGKLLASWHSELGQILYDGHNRDTLADVFDHATFVVFNYDRCIEEFLIISLMRRFDLSREESVVIVATCRIVHPYGKVGATFPDEPDHVLFGKHQAHDLVRTAAGIRTFTEAVADTTADQIKDAIAGAEVLVFMGFGWLPQNMELLRADRRITNAQQVFATAMNINPGEGAVINDQINEMLQRGQHAPPHHGPPAQHEVDVVTVWGDCKSLMTTCWLRLTRP